ncbi:MAG TPA: PAS domain-containing protein [Longilinea sp.]|nr:PAS domain-containing protein [Longilinea sp.]
MTDTPTTDLPLQVGAMTPEEIALIFTHLPVDVTFVDAGNDVRFYSGGKHRIFERTPEIIGRNVMFCHHPDSVQIVFKILEDFRAGVRDTAEFWIQTKPGEPENRVIHIRYFAVRDPQGKFYGTMEVTQDVTDIQKLQGERRLLDEVK